MKFAKSRLGHILGYTASCVSYFLPLFIIFGEKCPKMDKNRAVDFWAQAVFLETCLSSNQSLTINQYLHASKSWLMVSNFEKILKGPKKEIALCSTKTNFFHRKRTVQIINNSGCRGRGANTFGLISPDQQPGSNHRVKLPPGPAHRIACNIT